MTGKQKAGAAEGGSAQQAPPLPANVAGDSVPEVEAVHGTTADAATAQPEPPEVRRLSEEEQAEVDKEREGTEMVRWKDAQHFEIRTLTEQNWSKLGVEDGKTVHWYKGNDFMVPRSDLDFLTEDQFNLYILGDGRFEVVTV